MFHCSNTTIASNNIGGEGAAALSLAIKELKSLTRLDVCNFDKITQKQR